MIHLVSLQQLSDFVQPWADTYADSKALTTIVTGLHLGGMLVGGGLAIAVDRAVLRTPRGDGKTQCRMLDEIGTAHTIVVAATTVIVVSGLLFLAADIKTFLPSPDFWLKLSLVSLLLLNGMRLRRAEIACRKAGQSTDDTGPVYPVSMWQSVRNASITSMVLWFSVMVVGVTLTSI